MELLTKLTVAVLVESDGEIVQAFLQLGASFVSLGLLLGGVATW
jgi:hypothetical protein